jgi:hypothetical protein
MPIPNAHQATIPPEKLSEYLLNPLHPVGGPKASWFLMLGYQTEVPELLAADLLRIVGSSDDFDSLPDSFGVNLWCGVSFGRQAAGSCHCNQSG